MLITAGEPRSVSSTRSDWSAGTITRRCTKLGFGRSPHVARSYGGTRPAAGASPAGPGGARSRIS